MKKQIAAIASAVILCSGASAQSPAPQSTQPKAYMVADAHLDTQWNWDIQTTIKHYVWNTINQNLFLLKQYPDYIFNFEGGVKYAWMKEYYPAQYEEMKKLKKDAGISAEPVGMPRTLWFLLRNQPSVTSCSDKITTGKNSESKVPTFSFPTASALAGHCRPLLRIAV